MLHEEVADPARCQDFCRPDAGFQWKPPPPRTPLPLPMSPHVDKQHPSTLATTDDRRSADAGKPAADRFAALKAYCQARGLRDKCAEKWRNGNQCAPTVQLHVVHEFMDLFLLSYWPLVQTILLLIMGVRSLRSSCLSLFPKRLFFGADGPRTMRFNGAIQGHQLLILVDSGSSHSFLSTHIADQLQRV